MPMPSRPFVTLLLSVFALTQNACVSSAPRPDEAPVEQTERTLDEGGAPEADETHVSISPPAARPATPLTPELVFDVLVGEIAGQRGDLKVSVAHLLRASEVSGDVSLAQRATRIALLAHDYNSALHAVLQWIAVEPDSEEAMRTASILFLRTGNVERAAGYLGDVVARSGIDSGPVFDTMAVQLIREPNKPAALGVAEALLKRFPEDPNAMFCVSRVAFAVGDRSRAISAAEHALEKRGEWARVRAFLSRLYVADGRVEEGLAALKAALQDDAGNDELRQGYARLLLEAHRYDEARAEFKRILDHNEADADAHYAMGLLELDAAHPDDAEVHFMRLYELGERSNDASYYLGTIAEGKEQWRRAIRWYSGVRGGQYRAEAQVREARVLAKQGHVDAAVTRLQTIRRMEPSLAIRLIMIEADVLRDANRMDDAMATYDKGLEENPDDPDLLYARGLHAERMGHLDWLERDLRRLIEIEPENAHALNALGYTLADNTDRYAEALSLIERAYKLLPDDHAVIDSMGWVQYRLGNLGAALEYLQRAAELRQDAEIAAHLGEVLWALGRHDDAREVWRKALEEEPESNLLIETRKRFEN
ncbi:MAG: tetratricopeptide repeat protein [Gammaproteobacteria bacterium]|nr:tetratricopeptide repeat protein [Gammaproteobacteria bacterium]MCP5136274.1 tetratricopeptide repeat protein [Gammaproteobacteria bacterium]